MTENDMSPAYVPGHENMSDSPHSLAVLALPTPLWGDDRFDDVI